MSISVEFDELTDTTEHLARLAYAMSTQSVKGSPISYVMPSSCLSRSGGLVLSAALLGPLADMAIPEIVFTLATVVSIDLALNQEHWSGRLQYLSRLAMEIWASNNDFVNDPALCDHVRKQTSGINLAVLHEFLNMARADHVGVTLRDGDVPEEMTFEFFKGHVVKLWAEDLEDFRAAEAARKPGASA